jgi:AcrR family transcriptional regulator
MATQTQRRTATRAGILKAAAGLFQKRGFDDVAVEEITAAANVAKGTFYQHFNSKTEVLLALIRMQQAAGLAEVERRLNEGDPPLEIGRRLIHGMAQSCEENRKLINRTLLLETERPASMQEPSARAAFALVFAVGWRNGAGHVAVGGTRKET